MYVDVILPLPLEGLFTYSVPETLEEKIGERRRVLVPLGKSKTYTAIAVNIHDNKPDFDCKPILEVIDDKPILLPEQLRLWQWIADYYLSPLGDVYKAALPAGLKAEDGYRPKTETYITLSEKYRNEQSLHIALDMLRRAKAQQNMLITYLALSHYDSLNGSTTKEDIAEITREELLNESRGTTNVLRALTDRKILTTYEREVGRLNKEGEADPKAIKKLNVAQTEAYNKILFSFLKRNTTLLHGVTSSGKTEIYIQLIWKMLQEHKQVLYLLPEIALTVQMMDRLRKVFGNRLGIYHSKYSDAERVEIWNKQLSAAPYDVILGARSAVFLPFQKLGLIIVDEEHETSFKQQDPAPRYHARSAALVLANMTGAKTLLGTATPSMETYYNATNGKYGLVTLSTRYKNIALPKIEVVDTKDLQRRKMMRGPFSPPLLKAIKEALDNNEQVILFQNRRGFAPMIECRTCGWVPKCKNCDVSLTYHRTTNVLTCHYCGYSYSVPTKCPNCEETDLRGRGYGTEKIEEQILQIFPQARIARMDLDTTRTRNAYERIIGDFSAGRTNVLIGTQMVSKGLDFGKVSVVGILNADSMLNYPDFRAYEHAFMMMSQVSGRAGRKGKQGLVLLQTKSPELPVIRQVVENDFDSFYKDMLEERQEFNYPPFCKIVCLYLKHRNDHLVESAAYEMANRLRQWFGQRVLGPDKPSVAMVKQMNIRKVILKLENGLPLATARQYLRLAHNEMMKDKRYNTLQIYYDVDPL
ncbi:MAG: primosomal protein N' [Prevotella sp.]|nr:primosomal protein N' [Prevotella sp.]